MNKTFANYATNSLAIQVSQPQLKMLFAMDQGFNPLDVRNDWATRHSLIRKGLIDDILWTGLGKDKGGSMFTCNVPNLHNFEINNTGKLVIALAREAGIDYLYVQDGDQVDYNDGVSKPYGIAQ